VCLLLLVGAWFYFFRKLIKNGCVGVFSRIFSRMAFPSLMVLCKNEPLKVMSRRRASSLRRPRWKWCKRMLLGKERFGSKLVRLMNLAQAAPNVSFSFYWKVRTYIRRATIRDREESKTKFVSKFIPISINSSYGMSTPLFHYTQKGEWKQFPFNGFLCMLAIVRQEHSCSNSLRWV
jgi:hypothetical protein